MHKHAVGIDIVEIYRIQQSIDRFGDRFLQRIFTDKEIEYCHGKSKAAQHYAARFAAKEAVYKAARSIEFISMKQIEIERKPSGEPTVKINDSEEFTGDEFVVSISHCDSYAVAVCQRVE